MREEMAVRMKEWRVGGELEVMKELSCHSVTE